MTGYEQDAPKEAGSTTGTSVGAFGKQREATADDAENVRGEKTVAAG